MDKAVRIVPVPSLVDRRERLATGNLLQDSTASRRSQGLCFLCDQKAQECCCSGAHQPSAYQEFRTSDGRRVQERVVECCISTASYPSKISDGVQKTFTGFDDDATIQLTCSSPASKFAIRAQYQRYGCKYA